MIEEVIHNLRRLTTGDRQRVVTELSKPGEASRATMPANERRKLAEERVRLLQDFERRSGELEREHTAHLTAVEEAKRKAGASWAALADLGVTFRAERDSLDAQLLGTREPEVVAFLAEMSRELEELPGRQEVVGFHIKHRGGAIDRTQRLVDNAASVLRRANAIRAASTAAERLSLEALDTDALLRRLAALRDTLPPVEDARRLAEAARRREQEAIDAA